MLGAASRISLLAASVTTVPDTVRPADLLSELSAATVIEVRVTPMDTVAALYVDSAMPSTLHLRVLHRELRSALTWLLEGAPSYDRSSLIRRFGTDSIAMHRAVVAELRSDTAFIRPLLELTGPLLAAEGKTVVGMPIRPRVRFSPREAAAMAARFYQLDVEEGRPVLSLCAKPQQMRDRQRPEDAAVEAWFFAVVRAGLATGGWDVAGASLKTVPARREAATMEREFWSALEQNETFRALILGAYRRTAHWAPLVLVE